MGREAQGVFRKKTGTNKTGIWIDNEGKDSGSDSSGLCEAKVYAHTQASASYTWVVNHNSGVQVPSSFTIYNAAGQSILCPVTPIDDNTLEIRFNMNLPSPITGAAYFTFPIC